MSNLVYYRPEQGCQAPIRLYRSPEGMLVLEMEGVRYDKIRIAHGLPRAIPEAYIAVLSHTGERIALIHNLQLLDAESREEVQRELERVHLLPKIERIESIVSDQDGWMWHVRTTCGDETIVLHAVDEQLHQLSPSRWIIVNFNDHRCELRDLSTLDAASRQQAEGWLRQYV